MKKINFKEVSTFETPGRSPGFLLWSISTSWRSSLERTLKVFRLTHPQFVVLATLGWLTQSGERVSQAAIGKMAGLDPNTISQILKGLEQKGLIKREASSDGRAKNPILTAKGGEVVSRALPAVETADAQFFCKLTDKELQSLMRIFRKLS